METDKLADKTLYQKYCLKDGRGRDVSKMHSGLHIFMSLLNSAHKINHHLISLSRLKNREDRKMNVFKKTFPKSIRNYSELQDTRNEIRFDFTMEYSTEYPHS